MNEKSRLISAGSSSSAGRADLWVDRDPQRRLLRERPTNGGPKISVRDKASYTMSIRGTDSRRKKRKLPKKKKAPRAGKNKSIEFFFFFLWTP